MFGSTIDDAGFQLRRALEKVSEAGQGVVLYLRQSEHGLDLIHQLRTYALMQERGFSKPEASAETGYGLNRDYGVGAQILHELGLRRILLLTNHPPKVTALEGFELEVVGNVPLGSAESPRGTPPPSILRARRRRFVTRRNAVISAIIIAAGSILLILAGLIAYRMGAVDRYVANQIKGTLATYGIRAEIEESHTSLS